ncbi:MAG TPA: SdrD B-like domain-containing protein [Thermoanaerobaculia bacterium]|nr:SdrD B-like domain-containing protein [Thermoanaerobaculia bacterium]
MSRRLLALAALSLLVCLPAHATPALTATGPGTVVLGTSFELTLTLDQSGATQYAPFIDVIIPRHGADGIAQNGPCDGVTFGSAVLAGVQPANAPLNVTVQGPSAPCGSGGPAFPHPLKAWGVPDVIVPPGAMLVTIVLPYGSFDDTQPPVQVVLSLGVHDHADVGFPLVVQARTGFALGSTAQNDSGSDPPAIAPWIEKVIIPAAATITKSFGSPEQETVAGPNFPAPFGLNVAVPPGQKLFKVKVTDCLPASLTLVGATATPPATSVVLKGNCVTVTWLELSTPGTVNLTFFGNDKPAWTASSACNRAPKNTATLSAEWDPKDFRDDLVPVFAKGEATPNVRSLAVQKKCTPGPNGVIPGSTLTCTLEFQVNDYLRLGDLMFRDLMADGLTLKGAPVLTVADRFGSIASVPLPGGTYTVGKNAKGDTGCKTALGGSLLTIHLSTALGALKPGVFPGNTLTGGHAIGSAPFTAAKGKVVYTVTIDDKFQFGPHYAGNPVQGIAPDDLFVGKDDPLNDRVRFIGRKYSLTKTPVSVSDPCEDASEDCKSVEGGPLSKHVVGRNGKLIVPPDPVAEATLPKFAAGDTITFRVRKQVRSGDAQTMTFRDWVPKPLLQFTAPPVQQCPAMVADTFCVQSAAGPVTPSKVTIEPPDQHLKLMLPPFHSVTNQPATIDLVFSKKISNAPFADGLHFTNVVEECEYNSYGTEKCEVAIAKFILTEPALRISKGIVASSSPSSTFNPKSPSPVGWHDPLLAPNVLPRFKAPIISSLNPIQTITSNATADAFDVITYAIVVENYGTGLAGAYDIKISDLGIPPCLQPAAGSLQVTDGTGAVLAAGAAFPTITVPKLAPYHPTSGKNIIVISFNAKVPAGAQWGCCKNTAKLAAYAAAPGGPDFVAAGFGGPFTDSAELCVRPKVEKCIVATSEPLTGNNPVSGTPQVTIGETVRFRLIVTLPEGQTPNLVVQDTLPPSLAFLNDGTAKFAVVADTSLKITPACALQKGLTPTCVPGSVKMTCPVPASIISGAGADNVFDAGDDPVFKFQNVVNGENDPNGEYLVIEFNARVANVPWNRVPPNNVPPWMPNYFWANEWQSNEVGTELVEPRLKVTKSVTLAAASIGATYTLTITNVGGSTAFEVAVNDILGECLQLLNINPPQLTGGAVLSPAAPAAFPVKATLPPGATVTLVYRANARAGCEDCAKLLNKAVVTWTSLRVTGTSPNPTGSLPGPAGSITGERTGSMVAENNYKAEAVAAICHRVCGRKYHDLDRDGVSDPEEPGVGGWVISTNETPPVSATTDTNGAYCLDVYPYDNEICETTHPLWTSPQPCVQIPWGAGLTQQANFGNFSECVFRLTGFVFEDRNLNGLRDPGEPPVSGQAIVAEPQDGAGTMTYWAQTDANGKYVFDVPASGTYLIRPFILMNWAQVRPVSGGYTAEIRCSYRLGPGFANVSAAGIEPFQVFGPEVPDTESGSLDFAVRDVCDGACPKFCFAISGNPICIGF